MKVKNYMNANYNEIISNENKDFSKVETAIKIMTELQKNLTECTKYGSGPFLAAIYDDKNNLIAKAANSVVNEKCSNNHAEMNVIKIAEEKLGTYDLSQHNLKLYVTSEPCMMCLGAIIWSGIKEVYYGVSSKSVEKITGFDEGFKPDWFKEFKERGITVYGNIKPQLGEQVLYDYISTKKLIYKPSR